LFPEFSRAIKDVTGKTGLYLLKRYTKPDALGSLPVDRLVKEVRRVSKYKYGREQSEALMEFSKSTIGIREGADELALEIRNIISLIEVLSGYISEVEEAMESVLREVPISRNIMSIKGIGTVTAAGLIGEIDDFSAFKSQSAILKYAGLNLYETSSGKHIGVRRITKRGRGLLRKLLFYTSLNLARKGGVMEKYYKRLVEDNGMPRMKALIAVSRKLLCVIYALVRDNSIFDENYVERKLLKKAA
jgi:transposase